MTGCVLYMCSVFCYIVCTGKAKYKKNLHSKIYHRALKQARDSGDDEANDLPLYNRTTINLGCVHKLNALYSWLCCLEVGSVARS